MESLRGGSSICRWLWPPQSVQWCCEWLMQRGRSWEALEAESYRPHAEVPFKQKHNGLVAEVTKGKNSSRTGGSLRSQDCR